MVVEGSSEAGPRRATVRCIDDAGRWVAVIASLVRFDSEMADDDVQATFEERADQYRSLPGLVQKIYLRFHETGEFGALYVWESEEALLAFRETELARSIPDAYRVSGPPRSELADVRLVVQPEVATR
jgi:heme-degrading monooxygenase HmoA